MMHWLYIGLTFLFVPGLTGSCQLVFGRYCGMCPGNCAPMFLVTKSGKTISLMQDKSDSFFKNRGRIQFSQTIVNPARIKLAEDLYKEIPKLLLNSTDSTTSFGCPGCTDGCGLYIELRNNHKIRKFYIDTQTDKLTAPLRPFTKRLLGVIEQLVD